MKAQIMMMVALMALTAAGSNAFAEQSKGAGENSNDGVTEGFDKGRTSKKGIDISNTKGKRVSKDWQKGSRLSTRKDLANAMEKSRASNLSKDLSIPPLFYQPLVDKNPAYLMNIGAYLVKPIERNGMINTNYVDGLSKIAQNRGEVDDLIRKDRVLQSIELLARTGVWMQRQLTGIHLTSRWGYEDWQDLAAKIVEVKGADIATTEIHLATKGPCRMVGEYTKIQCGSCLLDVSNNAGLPELTCGGQRLFSADSAGGVSLKVSITEGFSIRDTVSKTKSDDAFTAFTAAVNEYVDDATRKGRGVEATEVKKIAYSSAVQSTKKYDVVMKGLEHKDDASKILGAVGIK